ncbi:MAG TPA: O-antigen ligase family protein [Paludibacteraceae bacterium]|nr:O-antigen ligase family protein [Paludibacteraceae bacterium]
MKLSFKHNYFSLFLLLFTTLAMVAVHRLYSTQVYVTKENVSLFGNIILLIFALSSVLIFISQIILVRRILRPFLSVENFVSLSLVLLLVLSVFQKEVGIYATGFFVLFALVSFFVRGKIYTLNKVYYFIFLYAVFLMAGTIYTPRGFHFPEMTYTFYLLPLSFSLFRLNKQTLLLILKIVFRIMAVYMAVSVVYWWFNLLVLNKSALEWITMKFPNAYDYVGTWGHYSHPSYISLVLFSALISGFYLNFKMDNTVTLSKFELITYIGLCLGFVLVTESRIGLVELIIIVLISLLYYIRLKTPHFKLALVVAVLVGVVILMAGENKVSRFIRDDVRKADYTLAVNYIKEHPVIGAGYHQQRAALEYQDKKMSDVTRPEGAPPITYTHNQFLGDMVQFGIPGLICLLILLTGLIWNSLRSRSYLLQLFMLIYLFFMLIEEPLYAQEGITRFMSYLCLFVHISECEKPLKAFNLRNLFSKSKTT